MQTSESTTDKANGHGARPMSDQVLGSIAEQGFFLAPGSLAAARSACAELIFARALIDAQTATIDALNARLAQCFKSAA